MYLALYRKYRPRVFDDVISQDHITTTLKNQLKNGQSSHAYLFTGSRGTGKTTCAKILAKALNCTNLRDGNPCLECESCKSIDEDYSDIVEIDAASNNGVDNIRDLKEESFYAPMSGRYKVYIIDEVHMLSIYAFNALLKLIEEPPPHVVFIFATTEVHKVPATILSRCQRFEFRRIDINDSIKRLLWVAQQEGKKLTDDAAFLISKISEGGMRDALSLLDQCISVSDEVTEDVVRECAGISGSDYLFRIGALIKEQNTAELLMLLDELSSKSKDVTRLCEELISHFRSLMLIQSGADSLAVQATSADFEQLRAQSEQFSPAEVMRCIQILSDTYTAMGRVRTPALYLEMCFIRLCTPKLDIDEKAINARLERLEQAIKNGAVISAPAVTAVQTAPAAPTAVGTSPAAPSVPAENTESSQSAPAAQQAPPPPAEQQAEQQQPPAEQPPAETPLSSDMIPLMVWQDIVDSLPLSIKLGIADTKAYISGNTIYVDGGELALKLATEEYRGEIAKAASRVVGKNVTIMNLKNSDSYREIVENAPKPKSKVTIFLELAESKGIKVKYQK
ncbi:MAG: DNA polymerase III subunit gamma/tau [Ruminiclostridium sp.]|nr:DNA polymerase III subunit gamma/tau [Ruminiclostridium sp.]